MNYWAQIGSLSTIILLFLALFGYLYKRISEVKKDLSERIDRKVSVSICERNYKELDKRLNQGDDKFQSIDKKLDDHKAILVRLDTMIKIIAKKNGYVDEP